MVLPPNRWREMKGWQLWAVEESQSLLNCFLNWRIWSVAMKCSLLIGKQPVWCRLTETNPQLNCHVSNWTSQRGRQGKWSHQLIHRRTGGGRWKWAQTDVIGASLSCLKDEGQTSRSVQTRLKASGERSPQCFICMPPPDWTVSSLISYTHPTSTTYSFILSYTSCFLIQRETCLICFLRDKLILKDILTRLAHIKKGKAQV